MTADLRAEVARLLRRVAELEGAAAMWGESFAEARGESKEEKRLKGRVRELEVSISQMGERHAEELRAAKEGLHATNAQIHGLNRQLKEAEDYVAERGREIERVLIERDRGQRVEEESRRRAAEACREREEAIRLLEAKVAEVDAMEERMEKLRDEVRATPHQRQ